MSMMYAEFFEQVTGYTPFPFQAGLAEGPWPEVVDVPTGLGKTAAVVVAWLHRRLRGDAETGRRLVYCLPMRVLVEQTAAEARRWCERSEDQFSAAGKSAPRVHVLMGGAVDGDWDESAEGDVILIGTQDMLLSRALNRGYAMSRFRWPVHFGLLHNDCLWILDETQLMGVGVETSAQLQGLRSKLGTVGPSHTVWMSATLGRGQLRTVDHPEPEAGFGVHALSAADRDAPRVVRRTLSKKPLARHEVTLQSSSEAEYPESLATSVATLHRERGGLTLVVVNRVNRAQAVYTALRDHHGFAAEDLLLVHSRFRPAERDRLTATLLEGAAGKLVIATQAVEAGVDLDAHTMVTELAPWPSMVQRFGRCNRRGEDFDARVLWVDIRAEGGKDIGPYLPYDEAALAETRTLLQPLDDVGPAALGEVDYAPPSVVRPVVRRRDLLQLFDTTPDLLGQDLDVSRWVRDPGDTDVQLFWRTFVGNAQLTPSRHELCSVSLGQARAFVDGLEKQRKRLASGSPKDRERAAKAEVRRFDALEGRWVATARVTPGAVLWVHPEAGGYHAALGFLGSDGKETVEEAPGTTTLAVGYDDDPETLVEARWVELKHHLHHVETEAHALAGKFSLLSEHARAVATAGLWHDLGKAHEQFQRRLVEPVADDPEHAPPGPGPWAKSIHRRIAKRSLRPHFRHELASALAWLQAGEGEPAPWRDLVAFLVAAHHGKVRMSIRSVPGEHVPDDERCFSRGVWDGDVLPATELGRKGTVAELTLDLSPMRMGEGSWLSRMLALRDQQDVGPFRLALLETLVRSADWRASAKEQRGEYHDDE